MIFVSSFVWFYLIEEQVKQIQTNHEKPLAPIVKERGEGSKTNGKVFLHFNWPAGLYTTKI